MQRENGNPGALAGATGAGLPCYAIAAGTRTIAQTALLRQSFRLRLAFGLTEPQANALAVLIWGDG